MELKIRRAIPSDALFLTSISFGAKSYGNYPKEQLQNLNEKLTITGDYIEKNIVFVAEKQSMIVGYCSVTYLEEGEIRGQTYMRAGYWLDQIFIRPTCIKKGIGKKLIEELRVYCTENAIPTLNIVSDFNAKGFYEKLGAQYICEVPSAIEGSNVCLFEVTIPIETVKEAEPIEVTNFKVYQFNGKSFAEELMELEQKKVKPEKAALDKKLHELDQEETNHEKPSLEEKEESEMEKIEEGALQEEAEVANFSFTAAIGYRFQCEEETEEADIATSEEIAATAEAVAIEEIVNYDIQDEVGQILQRVAEENLLKVQNDEHVMQEDQVEAVQLKTEKEKMLSGEQYIAWGDEIVEDRRRARKYLKEFNLADPEDKKQTTKILKALLGTAGEYIHIEPDFKCNYGYNIHIGDNFYAGYNCVILDNAKVTIGDNCIMSSQVGIYTLAYPTRAERRIAGYEYAHPVTIGDNVWIGGGSVINAGVTIGNNAVIMPGSVVVSDVPEGVVIGGNPARVIKEIEA